MKNTEDTKDTTNPGWVERFVTFCIQKRVAVVTVLGIVTVIMAYFAFHVEIKTVFTDLLPGNHPYVKVNERFKETFGGSNVVSIMVETQKGDIFNRTFLAKVQKITTDLQSVPAANPFQIISLASKKLKEVRASTEGIQTIPIMFPDIPRDETEMQHLREAVLGNPLVYGPYVSRDLKAALITVDFYENLIDYPKIFKRIRSIVESVEGDGVNVRVVGEPMLYGWVNYYLPETKSILLTTAVFLILVLFLIARTWRGTLLPLVAGIISAIWALGSAGLLGFHMDPLVIVVAFLISARAVSHSVQLVTHFDDEIAAGVETTAAAARASMLALFKPGMLGVIADAGCMLVVLLTPIPLLERVSLIGTIWVTTIAISAVILTPVLLSWIRMPKGYAHPIDVSPLMRRIIGPAIRLATSRGRYVVLVVVTVIFIGSGLYAFKLTVGDAKPGSPILRPQSEYNKDAAVINTQFPGADRMFVVVAGEMSDALKDPNIIDIMERFQKFMEAQPGVGGSISLADVIPTVRRMLREGNPRYQQSGANAIENGEMLYMYVSGAEPGDMDRFCDFPYYMNGAINLYFRDHTGETIRTAVSRVKEFIEKHPLKGARFELAGGLIGVLAAVNEVILAGQIESIALGLLVVVICCAAVYRSTIAGMFFMVPVLISNTLTFSYMAAKGIGMNINTLPVVALGIGLGVDYAFYVVDGIREELRKHGDMEKAITKSLSSQGRGVLVTAVTLIVSVFLWCFSSLRFQADMGVLMAVWLLISALSALFVMPSLAHVFRPKFIVASNNR